MSVAVALEGVDAILHAGDVCVAQTLDELSQFAPVHVVLGNNDHPDVVQWGAVDQLELDLGGISIAMVHDSGPSKGRPSRMRRRFPDAEVVVFGHSHIPINESCDGQLLFNPGSPTDRRRQPTGTMGELVIEDGHLAAARIFPVT